MSYEIFKESLVGECNWFELKEILSRLEQEWSKSTSCRKEIMEMSIEISLDALQVFDFGAKKHSDSGATPNFLTPEGKKCSLHERGSSILRHAARTFTRPELLDEESNLPELLHLLASVYIMYIRHKRNIKHPIDEV